MPDNSSIRSRASSGRDWGDRKDGDRLVSAFRMEQALQRAERPDEEQVEPILARDESLDVLLLGRRQRSRPGRDRLTTEPTAGRARGNAHERVPADPPDLARLERRHDEEPVALRGEPHRGRDTRAVAAEAREAQVLARDPLDVGLGWCGGSNGRDLSSGFRTGIVLTSGPAGTATGHPSSSASTAVATWVGRPGSDRPSGSGRNAAPLRDRKPSSPRPESQASRSGPSGRADGPLHTGTEGTLHPVGQPLRSSQIPRLDGADIRGR